MSNKIQYDDPKKIEETIRRVEFLYDQKKGKASYQKDWEDKKKSNMELRKKGTKPPFFINDYQE
jgi:hypothetical protein